MKRVLSILVKSYLTRKSGDGEDYEWRLEKIAKILDDFTSQPQTFMYNEDDSDDDEPKRKKRKKITAEDVLPLDVWWEISLLIPYDDIFKITMFISKKIKTHVFDNEYFWKEKFETEFEGYDFPTKIVKFWDINKILNKFNPEKNQLWKKATELLLTKLKYIEKTSYIGDEVKKMVYDKGNELVLLYLINSRWSRIDVVNRHIEKYAKRNKKLKERFLIDIIPAWHEFFDKILKLISENEFEKKEVIEAFIDFMLKKNVENLKEKNTSVLFSFVYAKNAITKTYGLYKKEYNEDILLKLLKLGIVLNRYMYSDKIIDRARKEIDEEIDWVLSDEFKKELSPIDQQYFLDIRILYEPGFKQRSVEEIYYGLSKQARNSYIFALNIVRFDNRFFEKLPKGFHSEETDIDTIYNKIKRENFDIMKMDKLEYIRFSALL